MVVCVSVCNISVCIVLCQDEREDKTFTLEVRMFLWCKIRTIVQLTTVWSMFSSPLFPSTCLHVCCHLLPVLLIELSGKGCTYSTFDILKLLRTDRSQYCQMHMTCCIKLSYLSSTRVKRSCSEPDTHVMATSLRPLRHPLLCFSAWTMQCYQLSSLYL